MKTNFLSLQRFCLPGLLGLAAMTTALPPAGAFNKMYLSRAGGAYENSAPIHCREFDPLQTDAQVQGRRDWALKCGYISQESYRILIDKNRYPSFRGSPPPPTTVNAPCGYYNHRDYIACLRSCFSGDTALYFAEQPTELEQFLNATNPPTSVTTLAEGATLSDLYTMERPFKPVFPSQYRDTLVQISLRGKTLKVTADHPMVDGQGNIVEAQNLQTGDTLLTLDGPADIVALQSVDFDGYLWNVAPISQSAKGNVLVASGVFTGGLNYLSADNQALRIALRQNLVEKLLHP